MGGIGDREVAALAMMASYAAKHPFPSARQLARAIGRRIRTTHAILKILRSAGHCQIGRIEQGNRTRKTVYRFSPDPIFRETSSFHITKEKPMQMLARQPRGRPRKYPDNSATKIPDNSATAPVPIKDHKDHIDLEDHERYSRSKDREATPAEYSPASLFQDERFELSDEERSVLEEAAKRERKQKRQPKTKGPNETWIFAQWIGELQRRHRIEVLPEAKGKLMASAKRINSMFNREIAQQEFDQAQVGTPDPLKTLLEWAIRTPRWKDSFVSLSWLGVKLNGMWVDFMAEVLKPKKAALRMQAESIEAKEEAAKRRAEIDRLLEQRIEEQRKAIGL